MERSSSPASGAPEVSTPPAPSGTPNPSDQQPVDQQQISPEALVAQVNSRAFVPRARTGADQPAGNQSGDAHRPGQVFVISGPTAVGKGTVVSALHRAHPEVFVSISATTRAPRPREVDQVHYRFIDTATFDALQSSGGLLESAIVHNSARYGTPRQPVEDAVAKGQVVILEIDMQGAAQVRSSYPDAVQVFLSPPTWDELVRRLVGRGTETPEQRERRLATAITELQAADTFDHIVVNTTVGRTVDSLVELLGL